MSTSTESQNAALPATMKALVVKSRDQPLIVDNTYAVPRASEGSAVVSILATNVISYMGDVYSGRRPYTFPTPMVPGSGAIGRVEALGRDSSGLRKGQLVWFDCTIYPRDDEAHLDGFLLGIFDGMTAGAKRQAAETWRDGTFAQYARLPLENLYALDEARLFGDLGLDAAHLAGFSRLVIPFGGLDDIGVGPGETLIVAPATGPFGSAAVHVALAMGAGKVLAMGRNEAALADLVATAPRPGSIVPVKLLNDPEKDQAALLQALGGEGARKADAFFDISPTVAQDSTHFGSCVRMVRAGGRVSLMGGIHGDVQLPHQHIMRRGLTVRGTWMYTPAQARRLIRLVEAGMLDLSEGPKNKTTSYKLEEWKEAFDFAEKNGTPGVNVIIEPSK